MASELPGSYVPSGGGIFSGSTGGVLGDFVEAAGMNGLQEAAGLGAGWGNVAAHGRKIEDLVAQGVPREQARQQALQQTAPQQAGLLGGLDVGALLPPVLAAAGAYFLLPEKYRTVGALGAAGAVYFLLKPKTA